MAEGNRLGGSGGGRAARAKVIRRPDGWPVDRFSVIEPVWAGETVACIGGGPSVTPEAVASLRGRARVIAINNAYLLAPWAEMCYFADYRWWDWHRAKPEFKAFAGAKVTIMGTGMLVSDPDVHMLHNYGTEGLSEKPNGLHTGCNGGFQAINIAVLAGAKRIVLLGYDMHYPGGRSHWHAGHPTKVPEAHYTGNYARLFDTALPQARKLGVSIVNASPGSRLRSFPIVSLETALTEYT